MRIIMFFTIRTMNRNNDAGYRGNSYTYTDTATYTDTGSRNWSWEWEGVDGGILSFKVQ